MTIPRSQVLQHCTELDCWIIVRNGVYNLTEFLKQHPGGRDIILSRAGGDATSFFTIRHGGSTEQVAMIDRFRIGELPEGEQIDSRAFDEPFIQDLTAQCEAQGLYYVNRKDRWTFRLIRLSSILMFFTALYLAFFTGMDMWLSILLVLIQSMLGTSLFGLIAHEHTHRNYPKNKALRIMLRLCWPVFWPFISQEPLRYEHNSHHVKIGDAEYDYEVAAFATLIRYSGNVPHRGIHRYQHRLAQFLYPFYANIITTIGGISSRFWIRHNRNVALEHSLSLLVTLSCFVLLPHMLADNGVKALLLYSIYQCSLFYGIYVGAAINHFIPAVMKPIPKEHANSYGYYVCSNTSNFAVSSNFWFWFTGGFNIQIEHHLVPFVPVENLRRMVPIVKALCKKYGYPYHEFESFTSLWQNHYVYLSALSEPLSSEAVSNESRNRREYQAR